MTFTAVSFTNYCAMRESQWNLAVLGKLRAFSGSSMNQMKNIRDQQEKLSKLHFDSDMCKSDDGSQMNQLVERLNQISHSIEKLNSSNSES